MNITPFTEEEKNATVHTGPDGRWYREDDTLATDREAAYAIWGEKTGEVL